MQKNRQETVGHLKVCIQMANEHMTHYISLGNHKLKQQSDSTAHSIWLKFFKNWYQLVMGMWNNRNSHSLLVGMQNSMSTLEDNFNRFLVCVCFVFFFNKTKPPLDIWSSNHTHYLPKSIKNLCPHKNLHTNTYNSIIPNCQTRCPSFGDWINCGTSG